MIYSMYKLLILSFTLALFTLPSTGQEKERIVLIETSMGNLKSKLYNDTPIHRDNFIELAKSGQYDGTLFYRVIKDFIIQGGSADSRNAVAGQELGYGREITIDAEIKPHHYHKKGALAAPRQPDETNPLKKSDISQFYFTVGRKYPPEELDHIEKSVTYVTGLGGYLLITWKIYSRRYDFASRSQTMYVARLKHLDRKFGKDRGKENRGGAAL